MYRLEIHHTTSIGPAAHDGSMSQRFVARLLGRSNIQEITYETEELAGSYATLEEADLAAAAKAAELTGVIRDDSAVVIIRVSDNELIDGVYPNDGGRF